jgi:hypothetical protein
MRVLDDSHSHPRHSSNRGVEPETQLDQHPRKAMYKHAPRSSVAGDYITAPRRLTWLLTYLLTYLHTAPYILNGHTAEAARPQ